jgi:hypothetical protein
MLQERLSFAFAKEGFDPVQKPVGENIDCPLRASLLVVGGRSKQKSRMPVSPRRIAEPSQLAHIFSFGAPPSATAGLRQ